MALQAMVCDALSAGEHEADAAGAADRGAAAFVLAIRGDAADAGGLEFERVGERDLDLVLVSSADTISQIHLRVTRSTTEVKTGLHVSGNQRCETPGNAACARSGRPGPLRARSRSLVGGFGAL